MQFSSEIYLTFSLYNNPAALFPRACLCNTLMNVNNKKISIIITNNLVVVLIRFCLHALTSPSIFDVTN